MRLVIITPCYNAGDLLKEAVDSLDREIRELRQRFPDLEIEQVIVDDRSDDPVTRSLLATLARDPLRKVAENHGHRGPAAARNVGFAELQADWYGFLDADDRFAPGGLCHLVQRALHSPSSEWIVGTTASFSSDGQYVDKSPDYPEAEFDAGGDWAVIPPDLALKYMARPPHVFLGSMIVRADVVRRVGRFREDLLTGEDWAFTLEAALSTTMDFTRRRVLELRRGHASLTQNSRNLTAASIEATRQALRDNRFRPVRRQLRWTLISQYRALSDRCFAAGLITRSARFRFKAWLAAPWDLGLLRDSAVALIRRSA